MPQACRTCTVTKPAVDFPHTDSRPDGRDETCRACHASTS